MYWFGRSQYLTADELVEEWNTVLLVLKPSSDNSVNKLYDEKNISKEISCFAGCSILDKSSKTTVDPSDFFKTF